MKLSFLRRLALAAALSLSALGSANAATYTSLDSKASDVTFGYSQMSVKMDGKFGELKATEFSFDPANPAAAKVSIEVVSASLDAGYDEANNALAKDEWLAFNKYPLATFTSTKVQALGDNRYEATGNLTIKGVTKPVTASFTFKEEGNTGVFNGKFTLQRADFGVGEGQWKDFSIVANDIEISFHVVAKP